MTVLQLRGPMGLRVLQWCHPMLACAKGTSYCTRIITLYGAWKVDSGPRSYIYLLASGRSGMENLLLCEQIHRRYFTHKPYTDIEKGDFCLELFFI